MLTVLDAECYITIRWVFDRDFTLRLFNYPEIMVFSNCHDHYFEKQHLKNVQENPYWYGLN